MPGLVHGCCKAAHGFWGAPQGYRLPASSRPNGVKTHKEEQQHAANGVRCGLRIPWLTCKQQRSTIEFQNYIRYGSAALRRRRIQDGTWCGNERCRSCKFAFLFLLEMLLFWVEVLSRHTGFALTLAFSALIRDSLAA